MGIEREGEVDARGLFCLGRRAGEVIGEGTIDDLLGGVFQADGQGRPRSILISAVLLHRFSHGLAGLQHVDRIGQGFVEEHRLHWIGEIASSQSERDITHPFAQAQEFPLAERCSGGRPVSWRASMHGVPHFLIWGLFGDDHALIGDAGAPGIFQDHHRRLPVAPGLHAVHWRRVAERVVGPVMPQVVRR